MNKISNLNPIKIPEDCNLFVDNENYAGYEIYDNITYSDGTGEFKTIIYRFDWDHWHQRYERSINNVLIVRLKKAEVLTLKRGLLREQVKYHQEKLDKERQELRQIIEAERNERCLSGQEVIE
jgi:hypothetical protein